MQQDERSIGFLDFARKAPNADALDDARWARLRDDAEALGLFGSLVSVACSEVPEVDPAVRDELANALRRDLADVLGAEAPAALIPCMDAFVAAKGSRGPDLLARSVARVIHEVYDLSAHGFVQDDVLTAGELMAWGGAEQDARETARRLLRVSRRAARSTLGHLDGQMDLVHALSREELPVDYSKLDAILLDYAPRIFAQRLPSIAKSLVREDRHFRFAFVLWARLRGVVIGRSQLTDLADRIDPRDPMLLVQALVEHAEHRGALRRATETCPVAARIEAAFLARSLRDGC